MTLRLAAYSTAHFAVDFSCAFLLFSLAEGAILTNANIVAAFLTYNILAFGTEFVVGLFFNAKTARRCAKIGIWGVFAALSCGFFAVAWNVFEGSRNFCLTLTVASLFLAGLGNSFFHVGGGIDVLSSSFDKKNKYWRGGVFLSTGAVGLALGTFAANVGGDVESFHFADTYLLINFPVLFDAFSFGGTAVFLILCGVGVWRFGVPERRDVDSLNAPKKRLTETRRNSFKRTIWASFYVLLTTSAVLVRSFGGFFAPSIEPNGLPLGAALLFFLAFGSFFGKLVGGFLADRFGGAAVGSIATFAAIPALCWSADASPFVFFLGVVLLNVSTAITLVSTAEHCGERLGFAFGLTTLALLFGYFGSDFFIRYFVENDWRGATNVLALTLVGGAAFIGVSTVRGTKKTEKLEEVKKK